MNPSIPSNDRSLRRFTKYVTLSVLGMLGLSCYILADTFFIARGLGTDGLTALNLAIPVYGFIFGLGQMIGVGGATRYAISRGAGDAERAERLFTQSALLALGGSLPFVLAGLFLTGPLAGLLGADESVHALTAEYLRVILPLTPLFLFNTLLGGFVRNDGNPRLAMAAMLTGSLSNILLDYVFIFPLRMGMFGAALATGCAPLIGLMVLSLHFIRGRNRFGLMRTGVSPRAALDICALGIHSLVTELSSGVVILTFNAIILGLVGNVGVAAYGVIANLSLVALAVFNGVAQGIQPLLSGDYGAGNAAGTRSNYRRGVTLSVACSLLLYAAAFFLAEPIAAAFNKENDPALTALAVRGIRLYFTGLVFAGFNIVTTAYLSAVVRPAGSFSLSMLRGFVFILAFALLLPAALGMTGVWLAFPAAELCTALPAVWFLRRDQRRRAAEPVL